MLTQMSPLIDLKFDRVVGHYLGYVTFKIGASQCTHLSMCLSIFWLPDSNSKMLPLVDLKLDRVVGHHLG